MAGAVALPVAAWAQRLTLPVVGFVNNGSVDASADRVRAFRKGLSEAGYVEGQNVTVEYHWLEGQFDRLPSLMADLVRRHVAVIVTPTGNYASQAAKAATTTIPIVFSVGEDPVRLGLVASLARPGGNATGINNFAVEVDAKRLGLLHDLVPKAVRIAVLVNPAKQAKMPRYFNRLEIQRGCTYKWTYKGTAENGRQRARRFQRSRGTWGANSRTYAPPSFPLLRRGSIGEAMSPDALDIANALEDLAAGLRLDPSGGYDHTQNWIVRDAH